MIAHILILPHPEHRGRLLAPGAPCATSTTGDARWSVGPHYYNDGPDGWPAFDFALVLARDGAVCPEGVDRMGRVAEQADEPCVTDRDVRALLCGRLGQWPARLAPLGTLVLLDADGREVSDG